MTMKSFSGKSKGEELLLSSKIVYIGAVSAILRRLHGFDKEHAEYSKRYTNIHQEYEQILHFLKKYLHS